MAFLRQTELPAVRLAKLIVAELREDLARVGIVLPGVAGAYRVSNPILTTSGSGRIEQISFELFVGMKEVPEAMANIAISWKTSGEVQAMVETSSMDEFNSESSPIAIELRPKLDVAAILALVGLGQPQTTRDAS